jgi:hypothetical protein
MTMKSFYNLSIFLLIFYFTVFCSNGYPGSVRFENPTIEHGKMDPGLPLDWCLYWGKDCGQPAADYYCKEKGFQKAVDYKKEKSIGKTKILKTGDICEDSYCDGFRYIVCDQKSRRFDNPMVEHGKMDPGLPLDWCLYWGKDCGQPAADYYCKKKGFQKAVDYKKEKSIGKTKFLKTGDVCNNSSCDGFEFIVCD